MFGAKGPRCSHIRNLKCFYLRTLEENKNGGLVPDNIWLLPVHELTRACTSDWRVPTAPSRDGWRNGGPTLLAVSFSTGLSGFNKTSKSSCQDPNRTQQRSNTRAILNTTGILGLQLLNTHLPRMFLYVVGILVSMLMRTGCSGKRMLTQQ